MSERPDISVVMSVYNGAEYLPDTCDSVLSQQGVNFEFIIVNDGSTDSSGEILNRYAKQNPRVIVIEKKRQGLTLSLMQGCSAARGQYIARHDVGDRSLNDRLFLQKSALDADEDLAFVSSWTEYCGPQWEFLYLAKGTGRAMLPTHITSVAEEYGVIDGPAHHGSVMFRRNDYVRAGGYRAEFYYCQDWDLWYRLGALAKFQMIERPLYMARVFPESLSMGQKRRQEALAKLSKAAFLQRQQGLSEQSYLKRASLIRPSGLNSRGSNAGAAGLYFIGECLRKNRDKRALGYFKRAMRAAPLSYKPWVRALQCQLEQLLDSRSVAPKIHPPKLPS